MNTQEKLLLYRKTFKTREDTFGLSFLETSGEWTGRNIAGALGDRQILAHLTGKSIVSSYPFPQILGGYVSDYNNNCRLGVVDIDQDTIEMVEEYLHEAEKLGIPVYVENSKKKGYHLWHFFENETPAHKVRKIMLRLCRLAKFPESIELFPKQDKANSRGKRLGNYINLPLNGNFYKQGRMVFLDPDNIFKPFIDQWEFLAGIKYVPQPLIDEIPDEKKEPEDKEYQQEPQKKQCSDLLISGSGVGGRRPTMAQMGGYLIRRVDKDVFHAIMKNWNDLHNKPPLSESELTKQVDNLYRTYGISGEDLANSESPEDFVKYHPFMGEDYAQYVENLKNMRIKTCLSDMDIPMRGLCPGEVLVLLGRPHSGKTALAQSIMYDVWQKQGLPSLMFSLEMSCNQLYERGASMLAKKSGDEIEQIYLAGQQDTLRSKVGGYEGVAYSDLPRLKVKDMRNVIENLEMRPVLVVIDYLTIVGSDGKTEIEKASSVSKDIQALAKQTNTAIICLSQVSRGIKDEFSEINMADGYGSSAIEQDAFFIWAIWKDREMPNQRYLRLLKNKRGDAGATMKLHFVDKSPRMYPALQEGAKYNTTGLEDNAHEF